MQKPSERIKEIFDSNTKNRDRAEEFITSIILYLDELHEENQKWRSGIEDKLDKLTGNTTNQFSGISIGSAPLPNIEACSGFGKIIKEPIGVNTNPFSGSSGGKAIGKVYNGDEEMGTPQPNTIAGGYPPGKAEGTFSDPSPSQMEKHNEEMSAISRDIKSSPSDERNDSSKCKHDGAIAGGVRNGKSALTCCQCDANLTKDERNDIEDLEIIRIEIYKQVRHMAKHEDYFGITDLILSYANKLPSSPNVKVYIPSELEMFKYIRQRWILEGGDLADNSLKDITKNLRDYLVKNVRIENEGAE